MTAFRDTIITKDIAHHHVSVLIVGAGPTGLAAANLLGQYGITTLLIERDAELCTFPRAISIDDEGLRICQAIGLRAELQHHVLSDLSARYVSHNKTLVHVTPGTQHNGYPSISTFHQPYLDTLFLKNLHRFPCVDIRFGHTLEMFTQDDQRVKATIRDPTGELQHITCAYLLACDGGKSGVRHALNIRMCGVTFPQRWIVVDSLWEGAPSQQSPPTITFFCDPTRPAVSVPAPEERRRWEFMLLPGEDEKHLLAPENLRRLIQQAGGPFDPHIVRQAIYTFHAAYATKFSQGRVFLLGDAAHMLPPFGGQGMNSGLRDAYNLAWKLAIVLQGRINSTLLQSYQAERKPHAIRMIRFSSFLGHMIMPTSRPLAMIRDGTLRIIMRLPFIANTLKNARIKPEPVYKQGFLISTKHRFSSRLTGQLLPQPTIIQVPDTPMPFDDILGPNFALLRLYPNPAHAFASLRSEFWQVIDARFICIIPSPFTNPLPAIPFHIRCVLDQERHLSRFFYDCQDMFVLVRPDRFIAGVFSPARELAFVTAMQSYLFAATSTIKEQIHASR